MNAERRPSEQATDDPRYSRRDELRCAGHRRLAGRTWLPGRAGGFLLRLDRFTSVGNGRVLVAVADGVVRGFAAVEMTYPSIIRTLSLISRRLRSAGRHGARASADGCSALSSRRRVTPAAVTSSLRAPSIAPTRTPSIRPLNGHSPGGGSASPSAEPNDVCVRSGRHVLGAVHRTPPVPDSPSQAPRCSTNRFRWGSMLVTSSSSRTCWRANEEPTLRRTFEADYVAYCRHTGRWWPKR